jgi:MFS family permease
MAMAAGAIGGPLLGSLLVAQYGVRSVFVIVSVLTGLATLLVVLFADERRSPAELTDGHGSISFANMLRGLLRDLEELMSRPRLRAALLILFVTQFGIGATNPQLELFVRDLSPGLDTAARSARTGILFTAMSVANLAAMPLWGRYGDRTGHLRALVLASGLCAMALLATTFATTFLILLGGRVLLSLAGAAMGPCAFALAGSEAPEHRRGASYGAVFSSRTLSLALSAGAGGGLVSVLTIRGLFLAAALSSGVMAAAGGIVRKRHQRPVDSRTP